MSHLFAQASNKPAEFEVASIRTNQTGVNSSSLSRSGGRITLDNVSLRECIEFAYGIPTGREYELSGPGWLDAAKFDIAATFPMDTARDRVREMLQALLADRFGLKTHFESRKLGAYALLKAKRGPKLQPDTSGVEGAIMFGDDHITGRAISMAYLADRLSSPVFKLDRPVVDSTGITGVYDFTLKWTPDSAPTDGHSGASIFTALEEQLGLKLQARTVLFRILVVDHAEKEPTAN